MHLLRKRKQTFSLDDGYPFKLRCLLHFTEHHQQSRHLNIPALSGGHALLSPLPQNLSVYLIYVLVSPQDHFKPSFTSLLTHRRFTVIGTRTIKRLLIINVCLFLGKRRYCCGRWFNNNTEVIAEREKCLNINVSAFFSGRAPSQKYSDFQR